MIYQAEMADMVVEILARSFGISILIDGFSDKLEHLLEKII